MNSITKQIDDVLNGIFSSIKTRNQFTRGDVYNRVKAQIPQAKPSTTNFRMQPYLDKHCKSVGHLPGSRGKIWEKK